MFDDMFNMIGAMNSPNPTIKRTKVNVEDGYYIVSTVDTADKGPETAVIDCNGAHPVERYGSAELAKKGHAEWCEKIKKLNHVTKIGYGETIQDELMTLAPVKED